MAQSNLTNINVSVECFNEIANALEASGKKVNAENPITLTKDISIKSPIDYRQVTIRKDVMDIATRAYEPQMNADGFCITDSAHYINFINDVYNYIFKGEMPTNTPTVQSTTTVETKKPTGWN